MSNKNESATVAKTQNFCQLNKALVVELDISFLYPSSSRSLSPSPLASRAAALRTARAAALRTPRLRRSRPLHRYLRVHLRLRSWPPVRPLRQYAEPAGGTRSRAGGRQRRQKTCFEGFTWGWSYSEGLLFANLIAAWFACLLYPVQFMV